MDKKEQILHYHRVDGLSLREIARRTGLNRKTVTRYIREYEAMMQCSVDKQSTISVKGCHYSVPDHLTGQTVIVQLYSEKIRVYDNAHRHRTWRQGLSGGILRLLHLGTASADTHTRGQDGENAQEP